jgi:hypothetical protein
MYTIYPGDTVSVEFTTPSSIWPFNGAHVNDIYPHVVLNSRGRWLSNVPEYEQPECEYGNNLEQMSRAYGLYDQAATVQEYRWVTIDALGADSLPAGYPGGAFSLLDSVVSWPRNGTLHVEGTGINSKFIYVNTGTDSLELMPVFTFKVDTFTYRLTYRHPDLGIKRHTAKVWIAILEGRGTSACYSDPDHTVRLASYGSHTYYLWYNIADDPYVYNGHFHTGSVYSPGPLTDDTSWWIQPGFRSSSGPDQIITLLPNFTVRPFPPAPFTVHVDAPGDVPPMRWTGDNSHKWNDPQNWVIRRQVGGMTHEFASDREPSACTDVEIPTAAGRFPELADTVACNSILLRDRAMLKNPHVLRYSDASVEFIPIAQERDRFLTVSVPLMHTYSGDYHFTGSQGDPQWGDVYMHFFRQASPDGTVSSGTSLFSETFGHPGTPLDLGHAFNLHVSSTSATRTRGFTFPRKDIQHYTAPDGAVHPTVRSAAHRFVTDTVTMRMSDTTFALPVRDGDEEWAAAHFMVQVTNPYMAYLDLKAFLDGNSDVLSPAGHIEWDGYDAHAFTPVPSVAGTLIPPLRSFFVQKKAEEPKLRSVRMSPKWTTTRGRNPYILRAAAPPRGMLRVQAYLRENTGEAMLSHGAEATPSFTAGEDLQTLFYDANPLTVYTFAQSGDRRRPLALNASSDFETQPVPLGVRVKESGEVTLEFSGLEHFERVMLHDSERPGAPHDLRKASFYTFMASKPASASALEINDRFRLEMKAAEVGVTPVETASSLVIHGDDGCVRVRSLEGDIRHLQIFSITGALLHNDLRSATEHVVPLPRTRTYVVKALAGKDYQTEKVFVK